MVKNHPMTEEAPLPIPGLKQKTEVPSLWTRPKNARAVYVLAHGAGTGMRHSFLDGFAEALHERQIATFRFDFPYRAAGKKVPDRAPTLEATVAAAVARAHVLAPDLPLFAGGKSMGGRMTAQWLARASVADTQTPVRGLIFLGFPLHPPKKPSVARAECLYDCPVPMLFLQGSRDALADLKLLHGVLTRLGERATLHEIPDADHSFAQLKRQPPPTGGMLAHLADTSVTFMATHAIGGPS